MHITKPSADLLVIAAVLASCVISPAYAIMRADQIIINSPLTISEDFTLRFPIDRYGYEHMAELPRNAPPNSNAAKVVKEHEWRPDIRGKGNITEFMFGEWDIWGTISLDEGVTATVEMAAGWHFDGWVQHQVATISGPTPSGTWNVKANATDLGNRVPLCAGNEPGKAFYVYSNMRVWLRFTIERRRDAEPAAGGWIGGSGKLALVMTSKLQAKDGCSAKASCKADPTGFQRCRQ